MCDLSSPSWLLSLVKQEIAHRANLEDGCTGHFWESRFTSAALLDATVTLACMVYVDLNPVRAGLARQTDPQPTADDDPTSHSGPIVCSAPIYAMCCVRCESAMTD